MNKVILCGRLSRDPEVRMGDKVIARFSLAVDRKFKTEGQPTADFFSCISFGKQAEFIEKYLAKGTKIIVTGRLQNDNYTKQDGSKVYSDQIFVEDIEFAESKRTEESNSKDSDFVKVPDGIEDELLFN